MRMFHDIVFEGWMAKAGSTVYSDPIFIDRMGAADQIHVSGYASSVTGTSPTLTIGSEESIDRFHWVPRDSGIVNAAPLSTVTETLFQGLDLDPSQFGKLGYLRIYLTLGGTSPQGFFRVWVTGRDWSQRSLAVPAAI